MGNEESSGGSSAGAQREGLNAEKPSHCDNECSSLPSQARSIYFPASAAESTRCLSAQGTDVMKSSITTYHHSSRGRPQSVPTFGSWIPCFFSEEDQGKMPGICVPIKARDQAERDSVCINGGIRMSHQGAASWKKALRTSGTDL